MANQEIRLKAELRSETGSGAAGRLRRAGFVPAAVNRIKGDTTLVKLNAHDFEKILRVHGSEPILIALDVDGEQINVLMRELQTNVITDAAVHVDFVEILLTEKVTVQIAIRLTGEAEGVKVGGVMQQVLWTLDVECLPTKIVENFDVDVSELGIGDSLHVRDITLDADYTVITGADELVVNITAPRTAVSSTDETDEGAEEDSSEAPVEDNQSEEGA